MTHDREHAEQDISEQEIERLATALGDGTRRRVFFAVRESADPVTRAEVAEQVGIDSRLAGFHLDKLVEMDFLRFELRRRAKGGPGAGRPPKVYSLAETELTVALPERHYELLAQLLLEAMTDEGASPEERLEHVGFAFGRSLAEDQVRDESFTHTQAIAEVVRLLTRYGFAAELSGTSKTQIKACSCPFEEMAFHDPERVCGLDRSIWRGILSVVAPGAKLVSATARAEGAESCVVEVVRYGGD